MGLCCRAVFALFFFFVVCFYTSAFAGNRQIPNLPKNGKIDAKAKVVNEGGNLIFDVYQVKTSVKEENINTINPDIEQQKEVAKETVTPSDTQVKENLVPVVSNEQASD